MNSESADGRTPTRTSSPQAVGVILARGGSRGIPRKNARLFLGEPLIARGVRTLLESQAVTRVVVSTDDPEIAALAEGAGAQVPFSRPESLSGPDVSSRAALEHALRELSAQAAQRGVSLESDWILFQATSPGCRPDDIDRAWTQYQAEARGALVSVTPVTEHPQWMGRIEDGALEFLTPASQRATRRQDLPELFRLNGAITMGSVPSILADEAAVDRPSAYVMPPERSADLDEPSDWEAAERQLAEQHEEQI